jgi:predicted DNA binding CopG/RHH family protein
MTQRRQPGRQEGPSRIPDFTSRDEEARWFDTHDMADYQDEFHTVKVRFAKNLSENINIRLDPDSLYKLRSEAYEKGVGPTTLARMWIMEHLRGGGIEHQ